jgi:hypothetical protein
LTTIHETSDSKSSFECGDGRCRPHLRGATDSDRIYAEIGYLKPQDVRPFNYMFEPPTGTPWQNCEYEQPRMPILDARRSEVPPSLRCDGFELWDAPARDVDFSDEASIVRNYYPNAAELALGTTSGKKAYVFDHLVRNREPGRPALSFGRSGDGSQPAGVGRAHNDYTEESGRRRLAQVLQDASAQASIRRFCIVNIWRPLNGPVLDTPLALCDARAVTVQDLVASDVHYPNRTGEIYLVRHSERHAWRYFSAMRNDEALIFKQYDSQVSGVSRFTPHAAFDHPQTPPDAPLRRSIEVRCLVTFD